MQVIQLDENGYFIGVTTADESPLEEGVYLIPRNCIQASIPVIPEGKRAKRVDGSWQLEDIPAPIAPSVELLPDIVNVIEITKRQLYLKLKLDNKWDTLSTILDANPNLKDLYNSSHIFRIDDAEVIAMSSVLYVTNLQEFFNAASKL